MRYDEEGFSRSDPEAIGDTSRQGIDPRLQAQCWTLASWNHAQLMFCRPCRNTLLADRLGPGSDAATVKSDPTLTPSCTTSMWNNPRYLVSSMGHKMYASVLQDLSSTVM
jgi:hypothetical protein